MSRNKPSHASVRAITLLLVLFHALSLPARSVTDSTATHLSRTEGRETLRTMLWGAGRANVLDSYLSPLEYTGQDFVMLHRTERLARWGKGRVMTVSLYNGHLAHLASPSDNGREWDGEITAAGGWLYRFFEHDRWLIAGGGLLEASCGFTYNTRNSNNPAQGRLGGAACASLTAKHFFPFLHRRATASLTLDAPLLGLQFSPGYGRSYYEIFSLGHNEEIVRFTHPVNAPTLRIQADVTLPLFGAGITIGYLGDIRQSDLCGLKRHAWRHTVMIGYTRRLRLIR